jgi:hypothetical protein
MMLTDLKRLYKDSRFLTSVKELKGRGRYKHWYYYEVAIEGEKYYFNIVMLADGTKKLHAITDSMKKM